VSSHVAFDFAQSNELENDAELSQVFKTMFSLNSFVNTFHTVDTSQFFKLAEKNEKILMNVTKKAVNKTFKNARKKETEIEKKIVTYEIDYWEIETDIVMKDNDDLTVDEMKNKKNKEKKMLKNRKQHKKINEESEKFKNNLDEEFNNEINSDKKNKEKRMHQKHKQHCYERAQPSTEMRVLWASLDSIEPSAHLLSVHIVFAPHRSRSLALNSRLPGLLFVYLYLYDLL